MLTTGSRIGNWFLVICLFSVVSHVELVHLSSDASSFVPCFREGGHEVGRSWLPRVGGREVYKGMLWERELIQLRGTRTVPPILHRAGKQYFHGCPDMVKLVGYGSCSA